MLETKHFTCPHQRNAARVANKMLGGRMITDNCELVKSIRAENWDETARIFRVIVEGETPDVRDIGRDMVNNFHLAFNMYRDDDIFDVEMLAPTKKGWAWSVKLPSVKTVCLMGCCALALCLIVAVPAIWGLPSWSNEEVVVTKQEWNEMKEQILAMKGSFGAGERERMRLFAEQQNNYSQVLNNSLQASLKEIDNQTRVAVQVINDTIGKRGQEVSQHAESEMARASAATAKVEQFCNKSMQDVDKLAGQFVVALDNFSTRLDAGEKRLADLRTENNDLSKLSGALDAKLTSTGETVSAEERKVNTLGSDVLSLHGQVGDLNISVKTLKTDVEFVVWDVYTAIIIVACFSALVYHVWDNYFRQPDGFEKLTSSHTLSKQNAEIKNIKLRLISLEDKVNERRGWAIGTARANPNPHVEHLLAGLVKIALYLFQVLVAAFCVAFLAPMLLGAFAESARSAAWRFFFRA